MPAFSRSRSLALTLCRFFLLLLLAVSPDLSASLDDEEQAETATRLKKLQQRINDLRETLNMTRDEHDRARNLLRDIEVKISQHRRELKYISARLGQQDRRMKKLYGDQARYKKDLQLQRDILGRQLRVNYMMGQQAWLKLLLSQDQAAATGRLLSYYDYFNQTRSGRIEKAKKVLARVDQVRLDIEREKKRLITLRSESQTKQQELHSASKQRAQIVSRLSREVANKTVSLNRMLEDEKQLQRLLKTISEVMPEITHQARRRPFQQLRGQLSWPVRGRVQRLFGKRRHQSRAQWNGVMIKASSGRKVHTVSHGRVAYADWLRGYGLLVIIDHGQGYMSLYGHNQVLFKETGDWVDSGEVIATVGDSGGQASSGLYFEIRHKGKPANPSIWCRQNR